MVLGDQVAPDKVLVPLMRLKEFTVGLVMAHSASAWSSTPPMTPYAVRERPSSPCRSRNTLSPFWSQSDRCMWQPFADRCEKGLGMKVARSPSASASVLTMYLKK